MTRRSTSSSWRTSRLSVSSATWCTRSRASDPRLNGLLRGPGRIWASGELSQDSTLFDPHLAGRDVGEVVPHAVGVTFGERARTRRETLVHARRIEPVLDFDVK